jgi:hypothetical protein
VTPMQASRALRELARVPSQISGEVSKRIQADIMRRFARGEDPYGRRWAPLKPATLAKGRHPPPLTDTGRGKGGIRVTPARGAGVQITSSVPYMRYHMRRTPHRAARPFLPEGVLPKAWAEIWRDALVRRARRLFGA